MSAKVVSEMLGYASVSITLDILLVPPTRHAGERGEGSGGSTALIYSGFDLYEGSGRKPSPRTMRESLSRGTIKAHQASPERETRDGATRRLANETAKLWHEEEAHER